MKLNMSHFTKKPFKLDRTIEYEINQHNFKPHGLWVSDQNTEDNWKKWCISEEFNTSNLKHESVLTIDLNNILYINTSNKLEQFSNKFKNKDTMTINWNKVIKEYSGIIITPYRYSHRFKLDYFWYYGWDCASGCIWNLNNIIKVED